MTLLVVLAVDFAISGVAMKLLGVLGRSDAARRYCQRTDRPAKIEPAAHRRSVTVNSIVSSSMIIVVPWIFRGYLFTTAFAGVLRILGETAAILLIYDFGYYLLHRFAFHTWSVGRRIHSVHHSIRTPYAEDSLYIHPAETAMGVSVFLASIALMAPVCVWSFGLAFLIYSALNLFIHSAIDLPFFPFRLLTASVRHHDIHHESMKSGYYASITPIWDVVFGTARRREAPAASSTA